MCTKTIQVALLLCGFAAGCHGSISASGRQSNVVNTPGVGGSGFGKTGSVAGAGSSTTRGGAGLGPGSSNCINGLVNACGTGGTTRTDGSTGAGGNCASCPLLASCGEGVISNACACGGTNYSAGYCCAGVRQSTPCSAPPTCFAAEVCGNKTDDDCNGSTDESGCINSDAYLADWKLTGQVVDYVVFGTYPLYTDMQSGRDMHRKTWGSQCVSGRGSSTPLEETGYCLGAASDEVDWQMNVPSDGQYVLMLSDINPGALNTLQVDRGAGFEPLPSIDSSKAIVLLDLGPGVGTRPTEIFYLLKLSAGQVRFQIQGSGHVFDLRSAVLAWLKEKNHYYPNPTYPHVDFTQQQIAALKAGPRNPKQQSILDALAARGKSNLSVTDLASMGRSRQGVLEDLTYSAVFNDNAEQLAKAMNLFRQQVSWLAANNGDYKSGDILMYGYDMRQLGTCYDQLAPHFADMFGEADIANMREQMSVEMMRHALSNVAGNWWRLPSEGGWSSSMAQGGRLGLTAFYDDKLAAFYFDSSILMYKTSLRDNVSQDGAYLQALGFYYGWDFWNLAYFLSGVANNPGVTTEDLWTFNDSSLHKYYYWLLYSLAPTLRCIGPFGSEMCKNGFYESKLSALQVAANHYQDGTIQWFHDKLTQAGHPGALFDAALTESLTWFDGAPATEDPANNLPLGKVTRGNEHIFMRTGWGQNDFAYMSRCGLAGNHNQREQGNFVLYADGYNYVQSYNNLESDTTTFTTNADKNFVVIDGRGQTTHGMSDRLASVQSFVHSDAVDYASCDNSLAYSSSPSDTSSQPVDYSLRRTLFVRPTSSSPGYFVVLDRIKASGSATHRYDFQLHPGCRIQSGESDGNCTDPMQVQTPGAPLYYLASPDSPKRLVVAVAEPESQANSTATMPATGFPSVLLVHPATDQTVGEFAVVLFPEDPSGGRSMPAFTRVAPAAGQVGFTLGSDTLLWSKDGSAISYSGISTNATAAVVRGNGGPLSMVALLEGTSLNVGATQHLKLSARSNAVMTLNGAARTVTVGNDMATDPVDLAVGGLAASGRYTCSRDGASCGVLSADGNGVLSISNLGPTATTLVLTPQ